MDTICKYIHTAAFLGSPLLLNVSAHLDVNKGDAGLLLLSITDYAVITDMQNMLHIFKRSI